MPDSKIPDHDRRDTGNQERPSHVPGSAFVPPAPTVEILTVAQAVAAGLVEIIA